MSVSGVVRVRHCIVDDHGLLVWVYLKGVLEKEFLLVNLSRFLYHCVAGIESSEVILKSFGL